MRLAIRCLGAVLALFVFTSAHAYTIDGVTFPQGTASFADSVFSYSPVMVGGGPDAANSLASNALGSPDYSSGGACSGAASDCTFASLGYGGSLILQFVDNILTGSNDTGLDLWIFEVGPDIEDMFVDISKNGSDWLSVGSVGGSTAGIDIDSYGYGSSEQFAFVRLTDDPAKDGQSGISVGADIDAVGAISTIVFAEQDVPAPGGFLLALLGLMLIGMAGMHRYGRSQG